MNRKKTTDNTSTTRPRVTRFAVTIRLPEDVVEKIDCVLARRTIPISRNNWLLEAAIEKLEKEQRRGSNGTK